MYFPFGPVLFFGSELLGKFIAFEALKNIKKHFSNSSWYYAICFFTG